jgi:hypothetical protein
MQMRRNAKRQERSSRGIAKEFCESGRRVGGESALEIGALLKRLVIFRLAFIVVSVDNCAFRALGRTP